MENIESPDRPPSISSSYFWARTLDEQFLESLAPKSLYHFRSLGSFRHSVNY